MPSKPRNSTKKNWVSRFKYKNMNKNNKTRGLPRVIASSPLKPKKPITDKPNWQNVLNI